MVNYFKDRWNVLLKIDCYNISKLFVFYIKVLTVSNVNEPYTLNLLCLLKR